MDIGGQRGLHVDLEANSVDVSNALDEDDDVMELEDVEVGSKPIKGKRKRRLTSEVWAFFEILPATANGGNKQRAKCKKCGAIYLCDSAYGTGNLLRHMRTCVRRTTREIGQYMISQDNGSMSMVSSKFDPEKFRELVAAAIIMHDLPFRFVEYAGIRAIFHYLHEGLELVSRNTAKADVLKLHKREKLRMRAMLDEAPGRICLTSDLWTSITTDGYICLTAHFLDKNWVLQKRVLNFSHMPPPHSGVCLSEKVYSLLCEWGIEMKVFSITLDNASANDVFVGMLRTQLNLRNALVCDGQYFHIRCCAHILNLIVQEGLKEINNAVQKVRDSIKYIRGSQVRKKKILECVNHMSLDSKKGLRQDVPTRWNSTFLMLESALFYRRAFCHLELSDSNYTNCPSTLEWDKIQKLSKFLIVFYEATCIFSGSQYPTANLYFPAVFMTYLTLKQEKDSRDEYMSKMAIEMLEKFGKYWKDFSLILAIAVILDPRYKLQFVDFCYKKLHGYSASPEFLNVREKLFALFEEYKNKSAESLETPNSSSDKVGTSKQSHGMSNFHFSRETRDVMKEFDCFESEESITVQKTQLELYLDEPRVDRNSKLDILIFWKANQYRYPELASMARDILSIPISTVASESAFSVGGRVLDQFRSALKPESVEALVCTRDWLFGELDAEKVQLDELLEDIIDLSIKDDPPSTQCSNSVPT